MDHYNHNNGGASSSGYNTPIPSIAPQQLQHNAALPPLNALQYQQGGNGLNSYSMHSQGHPITAPQTPSTSAPNTPGSAGTGGFQSLGQNGPQGYRPQPGQYQPNMSYGSSSMMPHSAASMPHQQAIAPAPSLAPSSRNLVPLRPMQPSMGGMGGQMQSGMSSPYGHSLGQDGDAPTHVVGSQGRRGILPSAPGRPQVTATGPGSTKNAVIPAKDADGKFPCPHCTKTYLHAKHLKRHLLRHTGDRPYMCILCKDTFSRSDILKRHFQKCSIRRGNPTGASHLSHAQAHLKKPGQHKNNASGSSIQLNGMNNGVQDGSNYPFGVIPASPDKVDENSPHNLSRAGSAAGDRRSMNVPTPNGSHRTSFDGNYGSNIPSTMSMNPTMPAYNMPNGQSNNGYTANFGFAPQNNNMSQQSEALPTMTQNRMMPMYGAGQQWNSGSGPSYFQPGAQDGFLSSFNSSLGQTQVLNPMAIKPDPSLMPSNSLYTHMYPGSTTNLPQGLVSLPSWSNSGDPFSQIVQRIVDFCCPPTSSSGQSIRQYLSQENVRSFLEHYRHFQSHFPILHMPTSRLNNTTTSLLLAMVCIGAVYDPQRIGPAQVRELMEQAKSIIEKESAAYLAISRGLDYQFTQDSKELEGLTAVFLINVMFIWHGSPVQRERVRRKFPVIVNVAKSMDLLRPSATPELFSVLHQPNVIVENVNSANFDWNVWIQQEKRSRLFFAIYLVDVAMCLYFNIAPQFDGLTISLPLPADDAAWEAKTATQCADALGLHGLTAAKTSNHEGSRRPKQLELHLGLTSLLDPMSSFDVGSTNLYSKFVLVHALHAQLWRAQTSLAHNGESSVVSRGSGTATPVSRRSTPVDGDNLPQSLRLIDAALQRWKTAWDMDMAALAPDGRRLGFCRDGVHFFYLARYLLQNKLDWQMAPDQRLCHIMAIIKFVRTWAASDAARRGESPGAIHDISDSFGVTDLTLNMAQLFAPIVV